MTTAPKWKMVTLAEVINHCQGKTIAKLVNIPPSECHTLNAWCSVQLSDGSYIGVESEFERDLSDQTPGQGFSPPTFWIGVGFN